MASQKYFNLLLGYFARFQNTGVPGGAPYLGQPLPDPAPPFVTSELIQTDYRAGALPGAPLLLLATCSSSDVVGASVRISAYDSTNKCPTVVTANPAAIGTMPAIGQIVAKLGDTQAVVSVGAGSEVLAATPGTIVAGAIYYIGTDGLPAKSGSANLPGGGSIKQVLGIGMTPDLILRTFNLLTSTF